LRLDVGHSRTSEPRWDDLRMGAVNSDDARIVLQKERNGVCKDRRRREQSGVESEEPRNVVHTSKKTNHYTPSSFPNQDETGSRNVRRKEIRLNRYTGKGCVETFIAQFQICAKHNDWSQEEMTAQLKCSLIEDAGQLIWDSGRPNEITYEELVGKLRRR